MFHHKTLEILATKPMLPMSTFSNRKCRIYRSANEALTGVYFTQDRHQPAYFELVIFEYKFGFKTFYLRYPNTEFYVELYGSGGASRGTMSDSGGRNVWDEMNDNGIFVDGVRPSYIAIKHHETQALIDFGRYCSEFNFLNEVNERDSMLKRNYLPLPEHKSIQYGYETQDRNYIIITSDAYNFTYETMECYYGNLAEGFKQAKISDFVRFKDGGTTKFQAKIGIRKFDFYSPSPFKHDEKPTWNGAEITKMSDEKIKMICEGLGITLAHTLKREED